MRNYILTFLKWLFLSIIIGILSGIIGTVFHMAIEFATEYRHSHSYLIYYLPLGGLLIAFMYRKCQSLGTNDVIKSVRNEGKVPGILAPLIFISTFITHLLGGSAGREGAALQLGGSIASVTGKAFKLKKDNMPIIIMSGMSGVFSALFGTPLTAAFFSIEVASVGFMHFNAIVPCVISALTSYMVSLFFGVEPVKFTLDFIPALNIVTVAQTLVLAVACALVAILFCISMNYTGRFMKKHIKNPYVRAFAGGVAIVVLTTIVGSYDYNGAGMNIVSDALSGNAKPEAFILKIIFTAITINAGFKGGEIVPTFFIGSTLGCTLGHLIGLSPAFSGALGLVALFSGVVNCPVASLILAVELFGGEGLIFFGVAICVSYFLSGNYSLYSSQKFICPKLNMKGNIENEN